MNEIYVVRVTQIVEGIAAQTLKFTFNRMADALEFSGTCIECGEGGTEAKIQREIEE